MKNQELFDRTIGILVNAYLNDTLNYFDCKACAVGNIGAANLGYKLTKEKYFGHDTIVCNVESYLGDWADAIKLGEGIVYERYLNAPVTKKEILSTGYTAYDLAKIERAFAEGTEGKHKNFNGLMAVCDTLMQIHEANEEEITQAKRLFVKEPA